MCLPHVRVLDFVKFIFWNCWDYIGFVLYSNLIVLSLQILSPLRVLWLLGFNLGREQMGRDRFLIPKMKPLKPNGYPQFSWNVQDISSLLLCWTSSMRIISPKLLFTVFWCYLNPEQWIKIDQWDLRRMNTKSIVYIFLNVHKEWESTFWL